MNNLPQTIATEVSDAINALLVKSERFRDWNDAEIQALVPQIENLQKVDAREAFIRFGALAAICGNVDDVFAYYDKALRLPGEAETKHEFWTSMGNAGLYRKAQEIGSWLLDPKRGFFPKVWQQAIGMGKVLEVSNRWSDAKKTYPDLAGVDFSNVENAVAIMGTHGLRDQDIVSVLDLMGEIQRAHRIMYAGKLVSILRVMCPTDDPPYLYFTIPLDTNVGEIHAMNRDLARLVVERLPEGAFPQGITASFAKAEPLALSAAA